MVGYAPKLADVGNNMPLTADQTRALTLTGDPNAPSWSNLGGLLSPPDPGFNYGGVLPLKERDLIPGQHGEQPDLRFAWPSSLRDIAQGTAELAHRAAGEAPPPLSDSADPMSLATGGYISNKGESPLLALALRGLGRGGDPNTLGIFAGTRALKGPEFPTDWFSGLEGAGKFEISDYGSHLDLASLQRAREDKIVNLMRTERSSRPEAEADADDSGTLGRLKGWPGSTNMRLGDVFNHPRLYEQYPDLADIPLHYADLGKGTRGGTLPDPSMRIILNSRLDPETAHSVLLHELQHAVQEKEGFLLGSAPSDARAALSEFYNRQVSAANEAAKAGDPQAEYAARQQGISAAKLFNPKGAYAAYRGTPGEVEARNVQERFRLQQQLGNPQLPLFNPKGSIPGPTAIARQLRMGRAFEQGAPLSRYRSPEATADIPVSKQFFLNPAKLQGK